MTNVALRERAGESLGELAAPGVAAISGFRRARMFHPDGMTFLADVAPSTRAPAHFRPLADALAGHALARFSGALWRRGFEHLDVLGIALRFRHDPAASTVPAREDQDLLFATIVSPFTMGLSPFTTRPRDFFANKYWAVSPFDEPGGARVKFRIVATSRKTKGGGSRESRLLRAALEGHAVFGLEVRRVYTLRWSPLATITLMEQADLDQERLRFSPFRDGRGIVPRGLVHAIRRSVYPASQDARPRSSLANVSGP